MGKREVREDEAQNNLLLVEGKNDQHVIWSLLEYYHVPELFEVKPLDGISKLQETSENEVIRLLESFEVQLTKLVEGKLGIIVDADTDLSARWQSLNGILISLGYNSIPEKPVPDGTVIRQAGKPVVGIWLMPDNKIPGMLEDFVGFLRPEGDLLWPMVDEAVLNVKSLEEEHRFRNVHESKARIHTWLAWQKEPGKPMGQAITARYLDADAPHAQQLITWIRRLFDIESA
ncbi:MAG TPA: DUF3226 domain-containing protein [Ktedonobacteraceae bacterium]|nr:DUF3226 domain-containing protein [Ktedonobacteraceae bacterium]